METTLANKQIHIVGGGTFEPVRSHLDLAAHAYGATARQLAELCEEYMPNMDVNLHLTKMADSTSDIETSDDLRILAKDILGDYASKIVFWSPMIADFRGRVGDGFDEKLDSSQRYTMELEPNPKIIPAFRRDGIDGAPPRKDLTVVGFKTTVGAREDLQEYIATKFLKANGLNVVMANDRQTRRNMIVTPEEAAYPALESKRSRMNRLEVLRELVEIVDARKEMTFTRSTVVAGEPVPWNSPEVFPVLRQVVDYCTDRGAYKPIKNEATGQEVTAGHFAAKIGPRTFLTSRRKTDFNELDRIGLVKVETDGEDSVIAYGSKPSVGGQSQRIVFEQHPDKDCIVHFHCPIKPGSQVPVVSQREYECGSHQCGQNTSSGLGSFLDGEIEAVYLNHHGPNLVFKHDIDPQKIIDFIEKNFDLSAKTGAYVPVG
jgi:hypothetical protein